MARRGASGQTTQPQGRSARSLRLRRSRGGSRARTPAPAAPPPRPAVSLPTNMTALCTCGRRRSRGGSRARTPAPAAPPPRPAVSLPTPYQHDCLMHMAWPEAPDLPEGINNARILPQQKPMLTNTWSICVRLRGPCFKTGWLKPFVPASSGRRPSAPPCHAPKAAHARRVYHKRTRAQEAGR